MSNSKFLDQSGVQSLWSKILNEDYVNSGTLTTIINAIDETKQDKITGAASTITNANLSSYRALVSDGSGKVGVSSVTSDELAHLSGVQENVQEQIDQNKIAAQLALPGTLKWDGVIGEREHIILGSSDGFTISWVRIGDISDEVITKMGGIPTGSEFEVICATNSNGEVEIETGTFYLNEDGFGTINGSETGMLVYIPYDNYIYNMDWFNFIFPKRGIYTICYSITGTDIAIMYASALTFKDMPNFLVDDYCKYFEKALTTEESILKTEHLPEALRFGEMRAHSSDTVTWDGNIAELPYVTTDEGTFYWVSDACIRNAPRGFQIDALIINEQDGDTLFPVEFAIEAVGQVNRACSFSINDDTEYIAHCIPEDNYEYSDLTWPKAGIYFLHNNDKYVAKLQIHGFKFVPGKAYFETIKEKYLPADLRHVGSAFDTVTTTTAINTIEWDGVVGDRLTITMEGEEGIAVHVSDYVPDMDTLDQQNIDAVLSFNGATIDFSTNFLNVDEGVYILPFNGAPVVAVALYDGAKSSFNGAEVVLPKAGIYFLYGENTEGKVYTVSISSPLFTVSNSKAQLKEEALPNSIFEIGSKPFEITWDGGSGEKITEGPLAQTYNVYRVLDYAPPATVFTSKGFKCSIVGRETSADFEFSAEEAKEKIKTASDNSDFYMLYIDLNLDEPGIALFVLKDVVYEGQALSKGTYLIKPDYEYFSSISSIAPISTTKIKESALPDSIKKPADWKQDDPTQLDYIANRPFYDEWDSVIYDSGSAGVELQYVEDLNVTGYDFDNFSDLSRIVPGKTYTIAIGNNTYTGTSFEFKMDGIVFVGIGNMSLMSVEDLHAGDTNANILFICGQVDGNYIASIATRDITESGSYWMAIVEDDTIKNKITREDGENFEQPGFHGIKVSDAYITVDDLRGGFSLEYSDHNGNINVLTEADIYDGTGDRLNKLTLNATHENYKNLPEDAFAISMYHGVLAEMVLSLKEDVDLTPQYTEMTVHVPKGTYLLNHATASPSCLSLTLNQSTAFAPYTPIKKIDRKYLPDQIQSSWKQNDSEQPDFIKDKPFYDGWSSVIFDSKKHMGGDVQFIDVEDGVVGFYSTISSLTSMGIDVSAIKPNKTYTLAVDDKRYTSTAFEITEDGMSGVCIGNIGVMLGDTNLGDPNAEFLLAYAKDQDIFLLLMLDDTTIGDHWFAMVEGDKIGDTLTKDDRGTGYFNTEQYPNNSDTIITKDDLVNGFEIVIETNSNGNTVTLTQDDVEIDDYIITAAGAAAGFGITISCRSLGIENNLWSQVMCVSPKDQVVGELNDVRIKISKGIYFFNAIDFYAHVVSFKINNSTVFVPSVPTKQLDEKYIPDTIARVADIKKQVQTNYLQGDPREIDFIKNRPFHDEWDSLMFESADDEQSRMFVKQDGFNGVFYGMFAAWPLYAAIKPETQFKVGNTYTFIINNKVYSGVATEYFYNGFNRIIIGNSNLLLPGSNIGDTNANFVVHYVDNMAGEDPDNFSMLYIDDITEAGEYPIAVYDAEFRDSLNWDDGEYHTVVLDDAVFFEDAFFTADDLIDGFTITIVRSDGTVFTFTEEDATLEEEDGSLRIWVNEKKRLALTCYNKGITENSHFEGLHGRCGVVLTNFVDVGNPFGKVTSFKPNNPKVLMPKYPAKKIDKRFLPDDIGGGTNEEEVNAIIAAPKTQFTLIDQVTGENYIVCMRDGNLVTYKAE